MRKRSQKQTANGMLLVGIFQAGKMAAGKNARILSATCVAKSGQNIRTKSFATSAGKNKQEVSNLFFVSVVCLINSCISVSDRKPQIRELTFTHKQVEKQIVA